MKKSSSFGKVRGNDGETVRMIGFWTFLWIFYKRGGNLGQKCINKEVLTF